MKKYLFLFIICMFLCGCSNNKDIENYNNYSDEIKSLVELGNSQLVESVNLFNKKEYEQSKKILDECGNNYKSAQVKIIDSIKIAEKSNFSNWIIEYKKILLAESEIRQKQCNLIKLSADKIQNDFEESVKNINLAKDLENDYQKLLNTANDIQNQYKEFFN